MKWNILTEIAGFLVGLGLGPFFSEMWVKHVTLRHPACRWCYLGIVYGLVVSIGLVTLFVLILSYGAGHVSSIPPMKVR